MNQIKNISFKSGRRDDVMDKQYFDHWKKNDIVLKILDEIKMSGEAIKSGSYQWAHKMVVEASAMANNLAATTDELRNSQVKVMCSIKRLKDFLDSSVDCDPELASFAPVVLVTEMDGKEYIINGDVNDKIIGKFKNALSSIESALVIIETRLKSCSDVSEQKDVPAFQLKSNKQLALFVYYSCLYSFFQNTGLTESSMSRTIAYLSKTKSAPIRVELNTIKKLVYSKNYDNHYFEKENIELVLNALRDCGLPTKDLEEVYIEK